MDCSADSDSASVAWRLARSASHHCDSMRPSSEGAAAASRSVTNAAAVPCPSERSRRLGMARSAEPADRNHIGVPPPDASSPMLWRSPVAACVRSTEGSCVVWLAAATAMSSIRRSIVSSSDKKKAASGPSVAVDIAVEAAPRADEAASARTAASRACAAASASALFALASASSARRSASCRAWRARSASAVAGASAASAAACAAVTAAMRSRARRSSDL
mmetsp:Transcript_22148/g.67203  ORF Transcript_22148/g.67203 Transcript_22148/m.67203 type:complete len:220 (-) Transcript_22148:1398-2057(-)